MTDPLAILQVYLDEVAVAVMRQDYATYRTSIVLPFQLVTQTASIHITDDAQLRRGFDTFAQTLQSQRISDYLRLAEAAEQLDERLISGRYVTHLMSGGHRVYPPFRSQITLRLDDGRWRAASITNALANAHWPVISPVVAPEDPPKGPLQ